MSLPPQQLELFNRYFDAGKPVVALRTSCHGFQNWLEFDQTVLGCKYSGHYGKGAGLRVQRVIRFCVASTPRGLVAPPGCTRYSHRCSRLRRC